MNKIPQLTLMFWVMKTIATTLGETTGDLFSMTMGFGYGVCSLVLIGVFLVSLLGQLATKSHNPIMFWIVIVSTSTAGTTISDYMDRTLELGYATGSAILITILAVVLIAWRLTEGTLAVAKIRTFRGELFYWTAILASNTLGTAMGDYLADDSGLGFMGGALLVGSAIAIVTLLHFTTKLPGVLLFWAAFVLTRPFGATFGDVLTKTPAKGGLGYGTQGSTLILGGMLVACVAYVLFKEYRGRRNGLALGSPA